MTIPRATHRIAHATDVKPGSSISFIMMRFTIIDSTATTTFQAPPHALKAIAACCASGATTMSRLIVALAPYDNELSTTLRDRLAIFLEHNVPGETTWISDRLRDDPDFEGPVVVFDEPTRTLSLRPGKLGVVVFNIPARRIVQIQNTYANLERSDRGRIRRNGRPIPEYYRYTLPDDWSIVP